MVTAYVPAGIWYDIETGVETRSSGTTHDFNAPLNKINVHVLLNAHCLSAPTNVWLTLMF